MEGNETLRGKRKSAVLSFTPLFLAPPLSSTAVNTHFYQPPRPATLGLLVCAGLITMIKVWWGTGLILFSRTDCMPSAFFPCASCWDIWMQQKRRSHTKDYDQKFLCWSFFFLCVNIQYHWLLLLWCNTLFFQSEARQEVANFQVENAAFGDIRSKFDK